MTQFLDMVESWIGLTVSLSWLHLYMCTTSPLSGKIHIQRKINMVIHKQSSLGTESGQQYAMPSLLHSLVFPALVQPQPPFRRDKVNVNSPTVNTV